MRFIILSSRHMKYKYFDIVEDVPKEFLPIITKEWARAYDKENVLVAVANFTDLEQLVRFQKSCLTDVIITNNHFTSVRCLLEGFEDIPILEINTALKFHRDVHNKGTIASY